MSENVPQDEKSDAKSKTASKHPLFGALKGLIQVPPGYDLAQPADPDWGQQT
jgi:hypothetical protein